MNNFNRMAGALTFGLTFGLTPALVANAEELTFTPAEMIEWDTREFEGETHYRLTEVDGREALHARCDRSASALYLEREINLEETPVIEWQWRINETFEPTIDERQKSGDDYAVRVYAVIDGGWRRWRTEVVNYVWASAMSEGETWDNAYARQAKMIAVRSGEEQAGEWVTERRNLADDFEATHGTRPETIDGIALMTDCDDQDTQIEGWYGTIRFLPE
ncbi:DUF3047 domain-containing protein [Marinimicrobium sp. ABcell2]|uniref:DUF3047 domain-containing protein n=1 Tax=Marinimicrobium sp. ABcell2 TaxID=3069751 RepID=UPI0027AEAA3A|nr:DUF3047 domain-containing protein [Marinimicrobium sp. ABcell2]MDQ2075842.1 DUF3047 domain-containing protein [Marinimicrobium sp. ABcell2]